ncbi:uncharacterized protein B0P05DRAFT_537256 [Gilbertella persicaria]|uniref:Uncharacterized protein n=1 Tax=Rhizopus stolonifer TaxID=4846 RepID=A0A367KLI4_RHIST|nr:uncharacterized protein B0P05DRAFT_537256 [Gilbertella persicaria]KAI8082486.1 hypothetical protein B0P05DRAFT_537256 [Gilbertella persicaria]RCI03028.1 hypothetical protein CU098_010659 [Rhizopus stolonifer]
MSTLEIKNDPFVKDLKEGDDTRISAEDMLKLLESLKLDASDAEFQSLLLRAKNGEPIERETLMSVVTKMLSSDIEHLGELTGSIGDFEIQFR